MERTVRFDFNPRRVANTDQGPAPGLIGALGEPGSSVVYVSASTGDDADTGLTEVLAKKTIYGALQTAQDNIVLMDGTFGYWATIDLQGKQIYARNDVVIEKRSNTIPGALIGTTFEGGQVRGSASDDNRFWHCVYGESGGLIEIEIIERRSDGVQLQAAVDTDFGATVNGVFSELTFNNAQIAGAANSGALVHIFGTNKVFAIAVLCSSASYGFAGDASMQTVICFDETGTPTHYYVVEGISPSSGTNPDLRSFRSLGTNAGGRAMIQAAAGGGGSFDYIIVEPNVAPTNPGWYRFISAPGLTAPSPQTGGITPANYAGDIIQWIHEPQAFNTIAYTLDQLYDAFVLAADTYASLPFSLQDFFYERPQLYSMQRYFSGIDNNFGPAVGFPAFPDAKLDAAPCNEYYTCPWDQVTGTPPANTTDIPLSAGQNPTFFDNDDIKTMALFTNGACRNILVDLTDSTFTVQVTPTDRFIGRDGNIGGLISDGDAVNCEAVGMSGDFRRSEEFNLFGGGTQTYTTTPKTACVADGQIDLCQVASFWQGFNNFGLTGSPLNMSNSEFIVCAYAGSGGSSATESANSVLWHCSVLKCYGATLNVTKIFGSAISELTGPFVNQVSSTIEDSIVRESTTNVIQTGSTLINVVIANPQFRSTLQPFDLRLKAIAKGDAVDSPGLGLTATPSIHGGNREAGAYDDNSVLQEFWETISIVAPWTTAVNGEAQSKTNKVNDGRQPTLSLSKPSFIYDFNWELPVVNEEREKLLRILRSAENRFRFYAKPVANPAIFIEGHFVPKVDFSSERSTVAVIAKGLKIRVIFPAPDAPALIEDYL